MSYALFICTSPVVQPRVGSSECFCLVSADSRSLVHAGAPTKALRARPSANVHGDRTLSSGARLCVRLPHTCLRVCVHGWGVDVTGAAFFSLIKQPVSLTHTWRMYDCVHSRKTSFCPITLGLSCCLIFESNMEGLQKCLTLKHSLDQSQT